MRLFLFTICTAFISATCAAEPVLVGMFYGANHVRATVSITSGTYTAIADGVAIFSIANGESADITESSGEVNIFFQSKNYTGFSKIKLEHDGSGQFKALPAGQKPSGRVYEENLIAFPYQGRLQLVNEVEVENYVSGVIEAESGSGQELEYYKVQAVISRTYALNNLVRHNAEGFQLCDATHCQVFHGKPRIEQNAKLAADETRDIVIVDHQINLVTATFHSNCGGQTINAEHYWSKPATYLVGRTDTFCINMPHSSWTKSFPLSRWNDYLDARRHPLSDEVTALDTASQNALTCYTDGELSIPMKTIREDFKLRSANFKTTIYGDSITFSGRGFGHGVGLCQEGAMRMATLGRRYQDVIHFYYQDVHLIPRYMMWFYRE
ncbi:MAG: SpoIID/LytB domain-containing protein [Flavobacteriales bacterium]